MTERQPDWSTLPPELTYIIPLAEKYGQLQFEDQIDDFITNGTDEEKQELKNLAKRLWEDTEDGHLAVEYTMGLSLVAHPESARIHFLLTLLTELGYS